MRHFSVMNENKLGNVFISRRYCFTLFEFLIVMGIIVAVLGIIGINFGKSIQKERFHAGIGLILDKLQLAQDLMLILKNDVQLKFYRDPQTNKLFCFVELEQPLQKGFAKIVNKHSEISGISSWVFENQEKHTQEQESFVLEFISGGTKMSRGILHLYGDDSKSLSEVIALPGYPRPIGGRFKRNEALSELNISIDKNDDALYPKEINKILDESENSKQQKKTQNSKKSLSAS